MSQPFPPDRLCHFAADPARTAPLRSGVALAALAALDVWLAIRLAHCLGALLSQRDALFVNLLAAIGCAMTAGAALLLTRLLIDDLSGEMRGGFS